LLTSNTRVNVKILEIKCRPVEAEQFKDQLFSQDQTVHIVMCLLNNEHNIQKA
jgi:hypothetical protein